MTSLDALSGPPQDIIPPEAELVSRLIPQRSIDVIDLVKEFELETGGRRRVLDGISFSVGAGERIAILGRNGAGKTTLVQVLSGVQRPTRGEIRRGLSLSWPLGFAGGFEGDLTGADNIRFIARIYDAPMRETFEYVADFSELGRQLNLQVKYYSSGMRMRLAFALSLAIRFECILIDEALVVGDRRFQQKCHDELFISRKNCAMIIAIHDMEVVKAYCKKVLVLKDGRGRVFDDLELAASIYATL